MLSRLAPLALVALAACSQGPDASQPVSYAASPTERAARRDESILRLFDRAQSATVMKDGLRLRFAPEPGLLDELNQMIEREQKLDPSFTYVLSIEYASNWVMLDVTGPPGTGDILHGRRK